MKDSQNTQKRGIVNPACASWKTIIFLSLFFFGFCISPVLSGNLQGTESILSTATWETDQSDPSIWGDRVIWTHYYPSPEDPEIFNLDLYLCNITSGNISRIPTILVYQDKPDIWKDLIVWQTYEDDNYEIHIYNLTSAEEKRITNDQVNQIKPQVWENWIVWQTGDEWESDHGVYLFDINSGNVTVLAENFAVSPVIWEDRVVWEDSRNSSWGNTDIYLFNITSGYETQITTDPLAQTSPSIWGDRIVWLDNRDISSQIYLYDLRSGIESRVTEGDDDPINLDISGDILVYINDTEVTLIDLSTMEKLPISLDGTPAPKCCPDIWENRVVWSDMRNGDFDIFLYTIGSPMPPLLADFTSNATQGAEPFPVEFIDNTQGNINGWEWDFGDGTYSIEQNPVHVYNSEGSYTVILTVHNSYQRNAVRKSNYISVGSEPVPQFIQNISSGPAPLAVAFTDTTSGLPLEWFWDFGDGDESREQNPLHIFTVPGVYNVKLTIFNLFGNATILKEQLITVMDGSYNECILPDEGINITSEGDVTRLAIDTSATNNYSYYLSSKDTILNYIPDDNFGISNIQFLADIGSQFNDEGSDILAGSFKEIIIRSKDIYPLNFTQKIGNNCFYNFTVTTGNYVPKGVIHSAAWEGCTPDDLNRFEEVKILFNYATIIDVAYTVSLEEKMIPGNSSAILIFAVSSDWVREYGWGDKRSLEIDSVPQGARVYVDTIYAGTTPVIVGNLSPGPHKVMLSRSGYETRTLTMEVRDERASIHVIRIGDDGTGEILNTTFIGHDPERNLDFFRAESPNGLSTFGLASLSRSGNLFQMIYLAISSAIGGGGGGGSGGGGRTSSGLAGAGSTPTPITTQAPTLVPMPLTTAAAFGNEGDGLGSPAGTPDTPVPPEQPPDEGNQVTMVPGPLPSVPATMVLLKNLSVVFVVILVTVVFYLRWKRRGD